jgi:hypothetical protein
MPKGKCWIYKRATLYDSNTGDVKIIDYSNGTREFDCEVLDVNGVNEPEKVFLWNVAGTGTTIPIPLNVNRDDVPSILRTGRVDYNDSQYIEWECIFGRYHSYSKYYNTKYTKWILFCLLLIAVLFIVNRKNQASI